MFVLITGGGRTATQLASGLISQNFQVHLVENRPEVLARLHRELPTEMIVEGHPTDMDVLDRAGIKRAQVVVACGSDDEDNLAVCFLARRRFQVPRIIARINNPRNAWLFDEKFHVDVALDQSEILSNLIAEEMSLGDMMTLLKLRRGEYSLVEEKIPAGAKAVGVAIKDLVLPDECVIAAIIRGGKVVVPRGITVLQQDDEVLAISDRGGLERLAELFSPPDSSKDMSQ
jgi:trk system potassium uptake protein TrkA